MKWAMKKDTATYQSLHSILVDEGCPICRLSQEAVAKYLDTLLWESSTDMTVHGILTASLGFCGRHSCQLLTFGGQRLAAAVVERAALLAVIRRLPELASEAPSSARSWLRPWQARGRVPQTPREHMRLSLDIAPCPACVRQSDEEARAIEVLLAHWDDFSDLLLAAGGLCLPHLTQAVDDAGDRERKSLLAIQQRIWTDLSAHLEEFIRKHMDQHHAEPIGDRARLSVERAIAALTGEYPVR